MHICEEAVYVYDLDYMYMLLDGSFPMYNERAELLSSAIRDFPDLKSGFVENNPKVDRSEAINRIREATGPDAELLYFIGDDEIEALTKSNSYAIIEKECEQIIVFKRNGNATNEFEVMGSEWESEKISGSELRNYVEKNIEEEKVKEHIDQNTLKLFKDVLREKGSTS